MDFQIRLGLKSGDRTESVVIRELEAIFSVSFRSWPTPGLYSAYDELADLSLDLDFDWTIETDFERVCPHVLNVDSMERER